MTPEEDYQEALRRIQEAKENKNVELDLRGLECLTRFPPELASLTSLQSLNLRRCGLGGDLAPPGIISLKSLHLRRPGFSGDLAPLAGLTSLHTLNLGGCGFSGNLAPLAGLASLHTLNLGGCEHLSGDLRPLASLTSLHSLNLLGCWQLSGDLRPLASLTSLHSLNLLGCERLSGDLRPLAALTSLQSLDLCGCKLSGDLSPLAGLTSLHSLNLTGCWQLSGDLSPLASLTSLHTLNLLGWYQLSGDLSALAGLTSLHTLNLGACVGIRRFSPLESLLPTLHELGLFSCNFEDLPLEVCGSSYEENVLDKVRAHYADLRYGPRQDTALKVFFLGNGGVGKTQLCRRLRKLEFDPSIPTTHGVQLGETTVDLGGFAEPVRLNLWDFGGQDIYHGSHALFLHAHAIFLILWTPESERQKAYQEGSLSFRHRPLSYWLDYLRAFAGTNASILIVQSQCDAPDKRVVRPPAQLDDFPFHRSLEMSARTGHNLEFLKDNIKKAVRDRFIGDRLHLSAQDA